ncbi:hypothetical protein JKP88DRAFT_241267 [Tribonema minus]|uniref:SWIB domain-containing protein n=1 Tax=Tribonema minus TaxID=303371 RepID=A0A835Z4J7_9STRA|nr:hypothetical protein JKP88DRAFT_241267 [Tribonema minus]
MDTSTININDAAIADSAVSGPGAVDPDIPAAEVAGPDTESATPPAEADPAPVAVPAVTSEEADAAIAAIHASVQSTPKFDCLYINTPWHALSEEQLASLPISAMTADDAALFLWCSTTTAGIAASLIEKWGFTFHSVAAVVSIAEQPSNTPLPAPAQLEDGAKKPRGPRVKVIAAPDWWIANELPGAQLSRSCSEQLWMAVRGTGPPANSKCRLLPFQVVARPDLAKKSNKARHPSPWCPPQWFSRRPVSYLQQVKDSLAAEAKIAELFGEDAHDDMWVFSPCLPTLVIPPLKSSEGAVAIAKDAIGLDGKVALRSIAAKLRRNIGEESWDEDVTAIVDRASNAAGEDWRDTAHLRLISWVADNLLKHKAARPRRGKRKAAATDEQRPKFGIAAPGPVSEELLEFFGLPSGQLLARTEAVAKLNAYVKENGLTQGKQIVFDDKLKALLKPGENDAVTYFSLCRLLSPHFPVSKRAKKAALEAENNGVNEELDPSVA